MKNIILFNLLLFISTNTLCQESQNIESQNNNTENSIENEVSDLTYLLNLNEVQILQITDIHFGENEESDRQSTALMEKLIGWVKQIILFIKQPIQLSGYYGFYYYFLRMLILL